MPQKYHKCIEIIYSQIVLKVGKNFIKKRTNDLTASKVLLAKSTAPDKGRVTMPTKPRLSPFAKPPAPPVRAPKIDSKTRQLALLIEDIEYCRFFEWAFLSPKINYQNKKANHSFHCKCYKHPISTNKNYQQVA